MRFLLDENVHQGLVAFLAELGHGVVITPKGLSNGRVLAKAVSEESILLTHDKDFSTTPPTTPHPGVVLIAIPPREIGQLKTAVRGLLAAQSRLEDFANRLVILSAERWETLPFLAKDIRF